jgi:hypothetical protein
MKKVTIGFSTSKKWNPFSALIKWWWNTPYSHVYVRWETPWGFSEILEASGRSVRMVEEEYWKLKNNVIVEYTYEVDRESFGNLMKETRIHLGKPYGWTQVVGLIFRELFKLRRNPYSDGMKSFVCSEIAKIAATHIAKKDTTGLDSDTISPVDIENLLKEKL